jgi:Protein of unknown function (DUF3025)
LKPRQHAAHPVSWQTAGERFRYPAFDSVRGALRCLDGQHWPSLQALNRLAQDKTNFLNQPIRFVAPQVENLAVPHYELRVARQGEIVTRECWHDLFNALVWVAFPHAKAAISEMHARIIEARGGAELKQRSVERDVLTLFDEGGAIVVSEAAELFLLLKGFQWKKLFWEQRDKVMTRARIYLFGHALLEKMLDPFNGITAKTLCFQVPSGWLNEDIAWQIAQLDKSLGTHFLDPGNLLDTKLLSPLPVLGWPGWHGEAQSSAFYDDKEYFRSGYTRARKVQ